MDLNEIMSSTWYITIAILFEIGFIICCWTLCYIWWKEAREVSYKTFDEADIMIWIWIMPMLALFLAAVWPLFILLVLSIYLVESLLKYIYHGQKDKKKH